MSPDLAVCALGALYVVAGLGVLTLAGMQIGSAADVLKLLGLAYLLGLASTSIVLIALLCVGVALSIGSLIAVSLILGIGGCVAGRRVHLSTATEIDSATGHVQASRLEWSVASLMLVALAGFVYAGFGWAGVHPLTGAWDAWAIWVHKGYLLYVFGHIPTPFFTSPAYRYMNQSYPMLVPVVNALWFHLAGFNAVSLHAQYWAIFSAALWALGYTASRRARPIVWVPLLCMFAVTPNLTSGMATLYADIPMALFLMLAILWLGEWIAGVSTGRSSTSPLMLATLLLAGAASTKNEGMTGAIAALAAAWGVILISRPLLRQQFKALAISTTALAVMLAPWQLWVAARHIPSYIPIGKGLDPAYVLAQMSRFGPSVSALYTNSMNAGWDGLLPIAFVVVAASVYGGRAVRREALFYTLAGLLNLAALVWVYVISQLNLTWWLATSASRTDDGFVLTAVAATFALCGQMLPASSPLPSADRSATEALSAEFAIDGL